MRSINDRTLLPGNFRQRAAKEHKLFVAKKSTPSVRNEALGHQFQGRRLLVGRVSLTI